MRGAPRPARAAVLLLVVVVVVASFCCLRASAFFVPAGCVGLASKKATALGRLPLGMVSMVLSLFQSPVPPFNSPIKRFTRRQSQTRAAAKRAKTTAAATTTLSRGLAMALYQGKAGSSLLEAMTEAVAQGE